MDHSCFSDQEMMNDVLSTQKFIANGYNTNAGEASAPTVKNAMMSILEEEHDMQHEIFVEMQGRGWYQTESAPQSKIEQTKQAFCSCCNDCRI